MYMKGDKTDCNNCRGLSLLPYYVPNFIRYPAVKVNSIYKGNYWAHYCGFLRNLSTRIAYSEFVKHLEQMGIIWSSAPAICGLQETLWLS